MQRRWWIAMAAGALTAAAVVASRPFPAPDRVAAQRAVASGRSTTEVHSPSATRPLTYAVGRTIHFGDRAIDTHKNLLSLDVTDDGVGFTTLDGLLWFTDGRTTTPIGRTTPGQVNSTGVAWEPAGRPNDRLVSGSTGSRLAWLEYPGPGQPPDLVVYDTRRQAAVARESLALNEGCWTCAQIVWVDGDHVYWTDDPAQGVGSSRQRQSSTTIYRYDVMTHHQVAFTVAAYQAELRQQAGTLVIGDSLDDGTVGSGIGQDFTLVSGSLVPDGLGAGSRVFDPRTGKQIRLRAPAAPWHGSAGQQFYLFQWIDEDTVALLAAAERDSVNGTDLLVCHLSEGQCSVDPRPATAELPIVPGLDTPGAAHAQARAVRAARGG